MLLVLVLFSFLVFRTSDTGLISQSSIQSCDWGDSNEPSTQDGGGCKEKFVVSMTLQSGQGETEALYANINQVQTSEDAGPSALKKPFRIEVQKSQTITNYRVYYRGSVNGLPREHTRIFSLAKHCHDGWYQNSPSCGKQRSLDGKEEFAWDSQGFCCRCSSYIREIRRSKGTCIGGIEEWFKYKVRTGFTTYFGENRRRSFGSSAHCMRMHDLWYDVYDIELPNMLYNISVRLLQYEGKIVDMEKGTEMTNWTTISTFFLSPSKTVGRSTNGKVVVELQGDLVGASGPLDFSAKKLLIPSLKVWPRNKQAQIPAAYKNGPSDWMLVDDHLVDLTGKQCNKVGVSYTGFKRQNSPCDKPEHSCFTNQPLQLWTYDDNLRKAGKPGRYMVHNFGRIHRSTHVTNHSFILRFIHTEFHNTFVTFRIDASDIAFVYNAAKGRIVDAYATNFTAVKDMGRLYVEVENTGEIEAEFSVILSECLGRDSTPSKTVSIVPGLIANVSFGLQSYNAKGEKSLCEVQLFDKSFNLLGTSKVDVNVKKSCFCFGECGCTCESEGPTDNITVLPCPTPPPIVIKKGNLAIDILFLVLEAAGIHGIAGFLFATLLFFGCIKLFFGGIFCRKTKAQQYYETQIKRGVDPKSPTLVKCTGECRGAKAAFARYKRKLQRLKKMGKDPGMLDDWRNTSYECKCREELADIRFVYVIKALCFYYYCFILPFVWLGKKIWWTVFKDSAANKNAAEKAILDEARKKGELEEYGMVDIAAELKKVEEEMEVEGTKDDSSKDMEQPPSTKAELGGVEGVDRPDERGKGQSELGSKVSKTEKDRERKKKTGTTVQFQSQKPPMKAGVSDGSKEKASEERKVKGQLTGKHAMRSDKDEISVIDKQNKMAMPPRHLRQGSPAKGPQRDKDGLKKEGQRRTRATASRRAVPQRTIEEMLPAWSSAGSDSGEDKKGAHSIDSTSTKLSEASATITDTPNKAHPDAPSQDKRQTKLGHVSSTSPVKQSNDLPSMLPQPANDIRLEDRNNSRGDVMSDRATNEVSATHLSEAPVTVSRRDVRPRSADHSGAATSVSFDQSTTGLSIDTENGPIVVSDSTKLVTKTSHHTAAVKTQPSESNQPNVLATTIAHDKSAVKRKSSSTISSSDSQSSGSQTLTTSDKLSSSTIDSSSTHTTTSTQSSSTNNSSTRSYSSSNSSFSLSTQSVSNSSSSVSSTESTASLTVSKNNVDGNSQSGSVEAPAGHVTATDSTKSESILSLPSSINHLQLSTHSQSTSRSSLLDRQDEDEVSSLAESVHIVDTNSVVPLSGSSGSQDDGGDLAQRSSASENILATSDYSVSDGSDTSSSQSTKSGNK